MIAIAALSSAQQSGIETQPIENVQFRTENITLSPAPPERQFRPQFPSLSRRFLETPNQPISRNSLFFNKTRPAPELGLGGRQQRKGGMERENEAIRAESSGQAFPEKPFISTGFSWRAHSAEAGHAERDWRREGKLGSNSLCFSFNRLAWQSLFNRCHTRFLFGAAYGFWSAQARSFGQAKRSLVRRIIKDSNPVQVCPSKGGASN